MFAPMISLEKVRKQPIWCCIKNQTLEPLIGLLAWLFPTMPLAKTAPNTMFPLMSKEYDDDPLCYQEATRILVAQQMLQTTAKFMEPGGFDRVTTPYGVFHSVHDTMTDMEGTEAFHERTDNIKGNDKTFFRVGQGLDVDVKLWHNLLREPGCGAVIDVALQWIEKRCPGK